MPSLSSLMGFRNAEYESAAFRCELGLLVQLFGNNGAPAASVVLSWNLEMHPFLPCDVLEILGFKKKI